MARRRRANGNLLEVQNAAKTMFANIRFQSIDDPIQSILLTSSVPDEGKTTTVWYLAQAMATAGNRVLMVEADMRRRSMANMLQLHPGEGLFAVLTGASRLEAAIVPTSVKGLFFLDAEPSIPNPPDLLASKRMKDFNKRLCEQFDYVIYDTPPVGTFVDAAVLSTVVDGVILVVRPGQPKRAELQMSYSQLENADAHVIGLCTTFVEGTGSEYYYSYYTKGGRSKDNDGKAMSQMVDAESSENRFVPIDSMPNRGFGGQSNASSSRSKGGAHAQRRDGGAVKYSGSSLPEVRPGISVPRSVPGQAGQQRSGYSQGAPSDKTAQLPRK